MKRGLADPPTIPCAREPGALCALRTVQTDYFACLWNLEYVDKSMGEVFHPKLHCPYRRPQGQMTLGA